jgi:drug/metabolite transporter (DMT)-like permease
LIDGAAARRDGSPAAERIVCDRRYHAPMRERPSLLTGSLIVLLAASGFAILGPVARFAYQEGFDPFSFVAWRSVFGLPVVLLVIAWRRPRGVRLVNPIRLPRGDSVGLLVAALAGLCLNSVMFFAFGLASVAIVLLAFYIYPAFVALVAVALGHERLDGQRVLALGLALGGMILVVAGGLSPAAGVTINPLGVGLALVGAGFQTVYVTLGRGRFASVPPEQATGWILLAAAVASAVLATATGGNMSAPFGGPRAFGLAVLAGVVGAGIPSMLFLIGIRSIGGTRSGTLMLFEPLVAVVLAAVLLHEGLVPIQAGGGAAILAAALLLQRSSPSEELIEPIGVPATERP